MQPAKMHRRSGNSPSPPLGPLLLLLLLITGAAASAGYDIGTFTEPPFFTLGARLGCLVPVNDYGAESRAAVGGGLRLGWVIDLLADLSLNVEYVAPALIDADFGGEENAFAEAGGLSIIPIYLQARLMYPAALSPYLCLGGGMYLLGYPAYDPDYDGGKFEEGARWGFNIGGGIQFGALGMLGVFIEGVYHRVETAPVRLEFVDIELGAFGLF